MSNSLLIITESHEPIPRFMFEMLLSGFPGICEVVERTEVNGIKRLYARHGTPENGCSICLEDGGKSVHVDDPGEPGLKFALALHEASVRDGGPSLEVFDQAYTFHVKLKDVLNLDDLKRHT